jgi:hypothetical protein
LYLPHPDRCLLSRKTAIEADTTTGGDTSAKWPRLESVIPVRAARYRATNAGGTDVETGWVTALDVWLLEGQCQEFFCFMFFHQSSWSFQIISKIRGDIHKSRCTTGGKFSTGINDTEGKFATGTGGVVPVMGLYGNNFRLFYTCKWTWRNKFIYMLTQLPKGLKIFSICHWCHRISPQICEKIWNCPNGILRGLGDTDSWKKIWSRKSRGTVP